jgi:signal transduction histidine kinase
VIGGLHIAAAWWGLCEVGWNLAPDVGASLTWMRASTPGWIFVGPLVLHTFVSRVGASAAIRRMLTWGYAACAGFMLANWTSSWMMSGAVQTSWGWGYQVGPVYPFFYAVTLVTIGCGHGLLAKLLDASPLEADRRQRPYVLLGMMIPMVAASVTDVLLPIFGVQVPRLGTISFAVLGALTVTNVLRFGYSVVIPGNFSDEILATLSDGVAVLHPNGSIRSANGGLARLTGRSQAELQGMDLRLLLDCDLGVPPRETARTDGQLRTLSAEEVPVAVACRAMCDRKQNPLGHLVSLRDLREVESLRSRLVTSDRLAALGQLAAGIAHEINNPLAFVRANLSHLQGHWLKIREPLRRGETVRQEDLRGMLTEVDELIEESLEGVDRAAEIVRGVRNFAHAGSSARDPVDLNELLEQVLVMAGPRFRGHVELERAYGELPPVYCAAQQIKQVLLNLVVNAAQALGEQGRVRVVTLLDESFVEVEVADDGPGIPSHIRERIFDPFFTTKAVGEGTGLGLGIALEIVHGHGGNILVDSEPGEGTRFRVRLPVDARQGRRD